MVTWVVERDVFSEKCFDRMINHFKLNDIVYHIVRVIPFVHEIEGKVPEIDGPCVVYGSIGTQKLAVAHNWLPGVWTGPEFNEMIVGDRLGSLYLNTDMMSTRMSGVEDLVKLKGWDQFFIKPNSDTKEFAGTILEADEFTGWYQRMVDIGYLEDNDFHVVISTPKRIGREWRLVVIDGKVVEYSLYKQYQKVMPKHEVTPEVIAIAEEAATLHAPADVYVVDVVETDNGLKIIEYNTFNSAGLYDCDVSVIIDEINKHVENGILK